METNVNPKRPAQVTRDKVDIARVLLRSAGRALERKQVSRQALHRLLQTLLANVALGQDNESQLARRRFAESHEGQEPPATKVISPTKACNQELLR